LFYLTRPNTVQILLCISKATKLKA
jgi:hypothetical protein